MIKGGVQGMYSVQNRRQPLRLEKKWKTLVFDSEMISKDIFAKESLSKELYLFYSRKIARLKVQLAKQSPSSMKQRFEEKLAQIDTRLKFLKKQSKKLSPSR